MEKSQSKATTMRQIVIHAKQAADYEQGSEAVKKSEKEKKKNWHQKEYKKTKTNMNLEDIMATDSNTTRWKKRTSLN